MPGAEVNRWCNMSSKGHLACAVCQTNLIWSIKKKKKKESWWQLPYSTALDPDLTHSALAEQIRAAFIEGTSEGQGSLLTLCCQSLCVACCCPGSGRAVSVWRWSLFKDVTNVLIADVWKISAASGSDSFLRYTQDCGALCWRRPGELWAVTFVI